MHDNKEAYNLSDMVVKYNDNTNKKVIGKFKPEHATDAITDFVAWALARTSVLSSVSSESSRC